MPERTDLRSTLWRPAFRKRVRGGWGTVVTMMIMAAFGAASALAPGAPASPPPCQPADLNNDGQVNVFDLLALLDQWGPDADGGADLTGDGVVDVFDLLALLDAWGSAPFETGGFPDRWITGGPACGNEPVIQVHQYNEDFYILRQSLCTNFEAPFMYLLFGEEKVLLQDTGAGGIPIAQTVYAVIDEWLLENDRDSIELIVSHSHGHGDHIAGNSQFVNQPFTTMTGTSQSAVANFFNVNNWPNQIVEYDLGGRIIDVIPIPGHQAAHIALYDRQTGILFTGDSLYPGRLYISNFSQFVQSIGRLVDFTLNNPVCWVLGTHIEMTSTPGQDFPFGATYHPDERELELTVEHLYELQAELLAMNGVPQYTVLDDFIIFPLGGAFAASGPDSNGECCDRPKSIFDLRQAFRAQKSFLPAGPR